MSEQKSAEATSSGERLILLGTHGDYIYSVIFDPSTKSFRKGKTTKTRPHPSWLVKHPFHTDIVYSNGWVDGKVLVYRLLDKEGTLEMLGETSSEGKGPTHLALMPDASGIVAAQYGTGATTHIPLLPSGLFPDAPTLSHFTNETIPSPHPRQEAPHAHQVIALSDGEILTPDLGSDRVVRTRLNAEGKLEKVGEFSGFEVGDGPRHAVLHPSGTHLYTLGELSSTLIAHSINSPASPISRHSILPPYDSEAANGPKMLACEIILLPSLDSDSDSPAGAGGKHLLIASNRDSPNPKGDAVALFAVSDQDGSVERVEKQPWIEGVGRHVRGVAADESGKWVLMSGRDGGGVKMFERVGEEGLELREVAQVDVENVVCPLWV